MLFSGNGYFLYFKYLQSNIRLNVTSEIKKGMKEKDLSLVVVTPNNENEIEWTKENKEFKYKGFLYDVVTVKEMDGKRYYYCYNDIKEQELIANFSRLNRRRNKTLLRIKKESGNKYVVEKRKINLQREIFNLNFPEYNFRYTSIIADIQSPPPKFNLFV